MKLLPKVLLLWLAHIAFQPAIAQHTSRNLRVSGSLSLEGGLQTIHVDQDSNRPWAYALNTDGILATIDLTNPAYPVLGYKTTIPDVHTLTSFRLADQNYLALAGKDIVVLNTTDPKAPRELARITPEDPITDLFAYKHSNGMALVLASSATQTYVYPADEALQGPVTPVLTLSTPSHPGPGVGFEDVFAGFDPVTQQDRLYLAGAGGYYIYDFTDLSTPKLLTTIHSAAVQRGLVIAPIPDARHALTLASYRTAPMRIFDLSQERVRTAVGAWTDNWQSQLVDVVARWPFAFVAALEDGLRVVNIHAPEAPYTDAWFRTTEPNTESVPPLTREPTGIIDVDVRNHDGLILVADLDFGLWLLELEAFYGWHGHSWGLPNMSDVQDWTNGPDGK